MGGNSFGWWSENLQNSDDTLLAGKQSVSSSDFDPEGMATCYFILLMTLTDVNNINNLFTCAFNRNWFQLNSTSQQLITPQSIYKNNVVPISPLWNDIAVNCSFAELDASTIGNVNNQLQTDSDDDWLYPILFK